MMILGQSVRAAVLLIVAAASAAAADVGTEAVEDPVLELVLRQGKQALAKGEGSRAERYFRTAIARAPENTEYHYWLGRALEIQRGGAFAITPYGDAVSRAPDNPEYVWRRIRAESLRYGLDNRSLERHERRLQALPEVGWQRPFYLGHLYTLAVKFATEPAVIENLRERAVTFYLEALAEAPAHPLVNSSLGQGYAAMGESESALAAYRRAAELDPQGVDEEGVPHVERVAAALASAPGVNLDEWRPAQDLEEALQLLGAAGQIAPTFEGQHLLGRLWTYKFNRTLADDDLRRSLDAFLAAYEQARAAKDGALALRWVAECYRRFGTHAHAIASYRRALDLAPHDAGLARSFGEVLVWERRLDEARLLFRWAEAFEKEVADARWPGWLPVADMLTGNTDQAIQALQARIADGQTAKNVARNLRNYLGLGLLIKDDVGAALAQLREADLDGWGRTALTWTLLRQGNAEEARKVAWNFDLVGALALRVRQGWVVQLVLEGTPGARAGLRPGDLLIGIGEASLEGWRQESVWRVFQQATTPSAPIEVVVRRGTEILHLPVDWQASLRE